MERAQSRSSRQATAGFAIAAALLTAVAAVSIWTSRRAADAAERVTHSMEVRFALAQLLGGIDDAEVGQRAFLASGLPAPQQTWEAGASRARAASQQALALTGDHPVQHERARVLAGRVEDFLSGLERDVADRRIARAQGAGPAAPAAAAAPSAPAAPAAAPGDSAPAAGGPTVVVPSAPRLSESLLDELRGRVTTLDSEEERLLRLRTERGVTTSRLAALFSLGGLLAAGVLALVALRRADRDRAEKRRATDQLLRQGALLQSVLLEMGDGCVVMDTERRLLVVNQAARRLYGLELDGELPADWPSRMQAFFPDKKTPFPAEKAPLFLATQGLASDRVMIWLAQGRGRWLSVTARPVRGPGGEVIAGVAVVRESNGPGAPSSVGVPNPH